MGLTLLLIRRNVDFDDIPGFGKLSGLMFMIAALLIILWLIDRTRIIAISIIPFYQVIIGFLILLVIMVIGWWKLTSEKA